MENAYDWGRTRIREAMQVAREHPGEKIPVSVAGQQFSIVAHESIDSMTEITKDFFRFDMYEGFGFNELAYPTMVNETASRVETATFTRAWRWM